MKFIVDELPQVLRQDVAEHLGCKTTCLLEDTKNKKEKGCLCSISEQECNLFSNRQCPYMKQL